MYFYDELEENDKDVQVSEKKFQDYLINEAILFLIDVSLSYNSDEKVSTIAKTALTSAYEMLHQKIIHKPTISSGILLYGTKDTNILESLLYPNLYSIMDLDVQSGTSIKNLKVMLSDDIKLSKIIFPAKKHIHLFNVLEYTSILFEKLHSSYKIKRIFLITHNDEPSLGSEDYKNKTASIILKLYSSGIIIEPFFITGKKEFDFNKFYKDILYTSKNINKIENHMTYEISNIDQLKSIILKRQHPKRFLFECSLQIAPGLNIDVRGYILFKKRAPIKTQNIYTKSQNPLIVKTKMNYVCQETSSILKNEDTKMAYDFGGEKILFSKEQMNALHFYEDPIIRILGFKSLDQLYFWENVLPSYFLYPIDNKNSYSSKIFASLAHTLYRLNKIAIAWFHPYKNSSPRICALISNFDSNNQNKNDHEIPQGIFAIILPFSDDIRLNPEQTSMKAPEILIDKMCEIIENLVIDTYDPLKYKNPDIQWMYKKLQSIILEEDSYVYKDDTIPNYHWIYEKSKQFIHEWNELLAKPMEYSFYTSTQLSFPVHIKIGTIKGNISAVFNNLNHLKKENRDIENFFPHLFVTVQLYANNKALTLPNRTSYKSFDNKRTWDEWLSFPLNYSDLPLNAQFAIVISDAYGSKLNKPFAGTTVKLFSSDNTLKMGPQKLNLYIGVPADGNNDSTTPSDIFSQNEINHLETLVKKYTAGDIPKIDWLDNLVFHQIEKIYQKKINDVESLILYVDFPQFDFPVIFSEYQYPSTFIFSSNENLSTRIFFTPRDPELLKDSPVEAKYRCLVRSHRNSPLDKELKPNAYIRDQLNIIMTFPPTQKLTSEEKDLIWKFRYYLTRDKRALAKFLKAVIWTDVIEVKQAYDLLELWTEIDIDDALELLGPEFKDNVVRSYAVNRLKKADDNDLILYLLQLVQALRFEESVLEVSEINNHSSSLANFLIERAIKNEILGINFYWYLTVECEDKTAGKLFSEVAYQFMTSLMEVPNGLIRQNILKRQAELLASILFISKEIRSIKESRPKKIERLRHYLSNTDNCLIKFEPLPLPLDPNVSVIGIIPTESTVFKSSLLPLLICFKTTTGTPYSIIFKSGDDLRQDQLVIQIVSLMDKLLRNENLDLKLTPYKILATGVNHGAVQFIESISLMNCLTEYHGSILAYFRSNNPDKSSELGVKVEVMDTYIKSCAGYCVITYLLGVGDRHLDNLLLRPDGRFFHADFGFILGRDPKPFSPAMKLCKEMVEGMGGASSPYYSQFKSYCYTAFITLRKSANLIMNLFALMVQSNISDIKIEPDKAVLKIKERFCLEMTDEEAIKHFQQLINDSVSAFFPVLIDRINIEQRSERCREDQERVCNVYAPLLSKQSASRIDNIPDDFKYGTCVYQCDISIRMDFLRKVYSILFLQIIGSAIVSSILVLNTTLKTFIMKNSWIVILSTLGNIITLLFLSWKRYSHPLNLYLLVLFTLFESCSIGTIVSFYNSIIVLEALLITTGLFLGLTIFTWQNKYDFSSIGAYLYTGLIALLSGGLVLFFFPYNRTLDMIYATLGALVFSGYILYDTSILMKHLSPEEYIVGSVSLYIDIVKLYLVNLFFQVLNIIAKLNMDDD
ncbi:hypothetical protein PORY_001851 [Pneumocystis oryctolagi]|uniref:Uncharacterized protein n=1 Tax=Pneumocystis oryctolagi TaxID=42067 RepID=A0ACB7CB54_9ASCO|nr:hypothetical protein PORY_001851 [Pneumocystis oryctolagi]